MNTKQFGDMTPALRHKVAFAVKLLQHIPQDGDIEISYSSGKDSDVILELAKMAGIPYRAIYKCTTIAPPYTIKHAKDNGAEIIRPKKTFFELIKERGMPSRFTRFCCEYLKEYKVCDRAVHGIRRSESIKRAKRYREPEMCRTYPKGQRARIYLPILEWTDDDVAEFIAERGIKCHPLYYDERGNFRAERRLGCIGCPLRSDNGKADFLKYPKVLKRMIAAEQEYLDTHPHVKTKSRFGNAYNVFFCNLFTASHAEYQTLVTGGMFPETKIDPKAFMENYFKTDLTI